MSDSDDFFGGGGPSVGSVSWVRANRGQKIVGTIVDEPRIVQKTQQDGTPLFWPKPGSAVKRPSIEDTGMPVQVPVFRIMTDLRDWDLTSEAFQNKVEESNSGLDAGEDPQVDVGVRDLYFTQTSASKGIRDAVKKARTRPQIGGVVEMTMVKRVKSGDFMSPVFEIVYSKPTEASKKVVAAYQESIGNEDDDGQDGDWMGEATAAGTASTADDDQPPF